MLLLKFILIYALSEIQRVKTVHVLHRAATVIGLPLLYFIPASEIDFIAWNNYQPKA
jgi:hypothetical protein